MVVVLGGNVVVGVGGGGVVVTLLPVGGKSVRTFHTTTHAYKHRVSEVERLEFSLNISVADGPWKIQITLFTNYVFSTDGIRLMEQRVHVITHRHALPPLYKQHATTDPSTCET